MEIKEALEKLGFTANETKVYISLLNLGNSLAGNISQKSGLHRRPTYDALSRLIERGLVTFTIKAGKKSFQLVNPEKILDSVKEQENIVRGILPSIKEKFDYRKPNYLAEVYTGKEGLKSILELILKEKRDWLSIGSSGKGPETLPYFLPGWHKRRIKLKISYKGLIADTEDGRKRARELIKEGLADYKFLPKQINHPSTTWVFSNKVAIILVSVSEPILFLIDNKEIAESYRKYFDLMWKIAKK